MVTSTSKSNYQGGTVSLRRNFQQGWTLQGAYTFGKAMNDADIAVGTTTSRTLPISAPSGRSPATTCRHKLALVGVWEMPFFKNNTGLTRTLLGGWQIAGSAIFQTGNPINITNGAAFPTRRLQCRRQRRRSTEHADASSVKTSGWSQEEYLAGIFKASDFPVPAPGTNGNLVRNAYRGPGYADVSLSLSKKFALTPRVNTEFASTRSTRSTG